MNFPGAKLLWMLTSDKTAEDNLRELIEKVLVYTKHREKDCTPENCAKCLAEKMEKEL